ncbi:MAG TPA: hypothetical protein GX734_07310 [Clostridiaceae bacterium]|nr:hypothetical protein [Clostridiaceae bacterium]
MSEEPKQRDNVKSREVVPRDKKRLPEQKQPTDQRPKGASSGQSRKRSGKQQQRRRKSQRPNRPTEAQGERRGQQSQQKKRRPQQQAKSRSSSPQRKEIPAKDKDVDQQKNTPKDLDQSQETKRAKDETQSSARDRHKEKPVATEHVTRSGERTRRDRRKRTRRDITFRAEETVEDIMRDIGRIEKDIQIDIDSIRNQKLDL